MEKTNNVCIVGGKVRKEPCQDALIKYTEPENLVVYTPKLDYNAEIELCTQFLNIPLKLFDESDSCVFDKIICFTNYIGIKEVMLLEEAVKANVDVILINPK